MTFRSNQQWRAVKVTKPQQTQRRDPHGNVVLESVPGIVIYKQVTPYTTREQLLIYRTASGWTAQLTGTEGKDVTDRLPQERWEELYSQPQALLALTGRFDQLQMQEIF